MASTKQNFTYKQEEVVASPKKAKEPVSESKKAKEPVSQSETLPSLRVVLNPADCDLDFTIERDGLVGYGLSEDWFSYCWSGARANVGITGGKNCFGCKIVSEQRVVMDDIARDKRHLLRLGVSRGDDALDNLGLSEDSFSFYAKIPNKGSFLADFWAAHNVGDTIICCVDIRLNGISYLFFSNGIASGNNVLFNDRLLGLGGANSPPPGSSPWRLALFPHVLLKNITVEMQFNFDDGLVPPEGFKPWALAVADGNAVMGPVLSQKTDCEVIMMVGLPTSGKTTWAQKCVKDRHEKRYVLLGINSIFNKMKVPEPGLPQRNNDDDDVIDHPWKDRATEILNRMQSMAATIPRNYIIDNGNNVYLNNRKDELEPFADFQKIGVVVFPKQPELARRSEIRFKETGTIPSAFDSLANCVIPKSKDMACTDDEYEDFDRVVFVELNREESQETLDQMKQNLNFN